jgi:hypothetical protein
MWEKLKAAAIAVGPPVGVGLVFAFVGLFNTSQFGWPTVGFYWVGLMLAGAVVAPAVYRHIETQWLVGRHWALSYLLASVLVAAVMTGFVMIAQSLVGYPISQRGLRYLYPSVLAVTLIVVALGKLIDVVREGRPPPPAPAAKPETAASDASTVSEPAAPPRLAGRLPVKLRRAAIWALESEDHYVRVHTAQGSDLILIRLADAIAEMDGASGLQVHRSWWVAREAMAQAARKTEGGVITLPDGRTVPVSRANAGEMKARGWM